MDSRNDIHILPEKWGVIPQPNWAPIQFWGKVGFLKTLKYIVRYLVRLKRNNLIKAATKNRVRIDHSLYHFIWMGF